MIINCLSSEDVMRVRAKLGMRKNKEPSFDERRA